jgi:uncharacterized membrane protein
MAVVTNILSKDEEVLKVSAPWLSNRIARHKRRWHSGSGKWKRNAGCSCRFADHHLRKVEMILDHSTKPKVKLSFNLEDASQVAIGAFALAVPISFSEEAWKLAETLPAANFIVLFSLSVVFLSFFAYESVFQGNIKYRVPVFVLRITIAYLIAGIVVALVLMSLNKFPLLSDPILAIKRMVVITMPASMGAIIVDSLDKE